MGQGQMRASDYNLEPGYEEKLRKPLGFAEMMDLQERMERDRMARVNINATHAFTFTVYGSASVDELSAQLQIAKEAVGGAAKVDISSMPGNQRESSSATFKCSGSLQRLGHG